MKKVFLILFFTILLFTSTSSAQILSPVVKMQGNLKDDTYAFFAGKTLISGNFNGYELDFLTDIPLFGDIDAFPLFGTNKIKSIDKVSLIDYKSLNFSSIQNFNDSGLHDLGKNFTNAWW